MNMRRFIYLLIWLLLPAWLSAQTNISAVEYWYDGDYGTAVQQTVTPGISVSYTDLLDVSSLEPGLHTATFRFQDDRGVWGSVLTKFFTYYPEISSGIHEITAVEYWFDGNYTSPIETSLTSGTSVDWNSLLNVSSLEPGLHTLTIRFQDTRGVWGSVLTKFFTYYPGTSPGIREVTTVEYWYDGDYSSAVETAVTSGVSVDWNSLLDVSSLTDGLHTVACRFKDDRGVWSSPLIRFFKKEASTGLQQIVALEYWFNDNYANKVSDSFAATSFLNMNEMLDVSSLGTGFHFVSFRLQDEQGKWGPVVSWYFTKEPEGTLPELHQLTAREYWFDGDYTTVQTDVVSTTSLLTLDTDLDVSGLIDGLHCISNRFRDEAGNWSPAFSNLFLKYESAPAPDLHEIVIVEYWIDGDISSATITSVPAVSNYMLDVHLDVSTLNDGLHFISYRFQDESGKWSSGVSHLFSKFEDETITANNKITSYRYWTDNMIGSAIEVDLATPLKSLNLDEVVDVSSLPGGTHDITFQFRDSTGVWSGAYTEPYFQDYNPRGTITAETNPACTQSVVTFTAETVDVDSIFWDFGDTTAIVGRSVAEDAYHAYSIAGTYTVTATFLNADSAYTATATTSITVNQSYGVSLVAPENLIAYYPLNGNADDESGLNHNGTVFEAIPTADRNGNDGQAYYFDGVNDYILFDSEVGPLGTASRSFAFWAKTDVVPGGNQKNTVLSYGGNISNGGSRFEILINGICRGIGADVSVNYLTKSFDNSDNDWHHYAIVFDNTVSNKLSSFKFYSDGELLSETCNTNGDININTLANQVFNIGRLYNGSRYFKGSIDELKIYDKALSAEEIQLDYEGTGGTALPPINVEICASETPYTFGTQQLSTSGTYYENFPTVTGCDSVVQLNLTVHPVYNDTIGQAVSFMVDDDFESYDVGSLAGWTIKYEGSGVANQKVVDHISKNGVKSFQLEGRSSWAADLYKPIVDAPEKLTIEAWINVTISNALGSGIGLVNYGAASWGARTSRISFENGRIVTGITGGTTYDIQSFTPGEWYHVRIEHDMTARVYSVYINGQKVSGTNGSTTIDVFPMYASAESEDFFLCAGNATTTRVYFDDVKMYVPDDMIMICSSETPYKLGNQDIYTSGTYTETFHTKYGCDSTVTINLIVNPSYETDDSDTICENDLPYVWGDSTLTAAGTYTETLTTVEGCDSIRNFTLIVNDTSLVNREMWVCENDLPLIIGTDTFRSEGIHTKVFENTAGCDSTVILTLNVLDTSLVTEEIEICESLLPFTFGTQSLGTGGVYTEAFRKANGCDSTVILTLTVKDTFMVTDNVSICESELPYFWEGDQLTSSGTYTKVLTATNGCDSTVNLLLTINDTSLVQQEITICENDLPYTLGTQTLTASGLYTEVFSGNNGCDSTIILTLNIKDTSLMNETVQICESDLPYHFGTQTLTSDGTYTEIFSGTNGCDSTVVLTLAISDTFLVADTLTICENGLPYSFGTQNLVADGTYTEVFNSSKGCDSTVVLVFNVGEVFSSSYSDTVCENDLPYTLGSQSLISSGTYNETFTATNGCDSIVTLALLVHESYNTQLSATVDIFSLPYIFGSQSLTQAGIYTNTFTTVHGCDSIITLYLQVGDNTPPVVRCHSTGIELSSDGTYTLTPEDIVEITWETYDDVTSYSALGIQVTPSVFTCENLGETNVKVSVTDGAGNESVCYTTILVSSGTGELSIDPIPDQTMDEDSILTILLTGISGGNYCENWGVDIIASHADTGLVASLNVTYQPFDSTAVLDIELIPDASASDSITVTVRDSLGNFAAESFLLTVNPVNDPPTLVYTTEDQLIDAGDTLKLSFSKLQGIFFNDVDDDSVKFNFDLENAIWPDWMNVTEDSLQFLLILIPAETDTGCYNVIVKLEDPAGESVSDIFQVCVDPLGVGITELGKNIFQINLYPNPTPGHVNIDMENRPLGDIELLVTNIAGSEVLRKTYLSSDRIVFDLSDQISGTYLVILKINQHCIVRKLILDRK